MHEVVFLSICLPYCQVNFVLITFLKIVYIKFSWVFSHDQGIIQNQSASGSRMLPLVIFDKEVLFSKNSVILQYFQEKLSQKCPFLKILDAALKF